MIVDDDARPLSIGAVIGGQNSDALAWKDEIGKMMRQVSAAAESLTSPLNVNVIFQVPGEFIPELEFSGVRTGHFDKNTSHLIVQAALDAKPGSHPQEELMSLLDMAVDVAEQFARKRGLGDDLSVQRALLRNLRGSGR